MSVQNTIRFVVTLDIREEDIQRLARGGAWKQVPVIAGMILWDTCCIVYVSIFFK